MPTVPGGARVVFEWVADGRERAAVFHATKSQDWTLADLVTLANEFRDCWTNTWRGYVANNLVLLNVVATSLKGSSSEQYTLPCVSNCAGTQTVQALPGNVTSTISWRTGGIGRSKRGRTFGPGYIITDVNEDDTVTSAKLTQLAVLANAILQAAFDAGGSLGVFSRVLNVITAITGYAMENLLDSQRDRLTGRGS